MVTLKAWWTLRRRWFLGVLYLEMEGVKYPFRVGDTATITDQQGNGLRIERRTRTVMYIGAFEVAKRWL